MCWDCVTGVKLPSTVFCVCHFPTVSTVQHHCCSAAQSLCPLCVTSPLSAQCNATVVQLHSYFAPPVYKTVYSKFSVLLRPNSETAARGGGEN